MLNLSWSWRSIQGQSQQKEYKKIINNFSKWLWKYIHLKEKRENKRRPKGKVSNHTLASWGSIKVHMATFSILLLEESKGWTIQNEWQSWVEHLKVYDERGSEQPLSFAIDLANLIWSKWQNMRFFYYTKKTQRVPKKTWEGKKQNLFTICCYTNYEFSCLIKLSSQRFNYWLYVEIRQAVSILNRLLCDEIESF